MIASMAGDLRGLGGESVGWTRSAGDAERGAGSTNAADDQATGADDCGRCRHGRCRHGRCRRGRLSVEGWRPDRILASGKAGVARRMQV